MPGGGGRRAGRRRVALWSGAGLAAAGLLTIAGIAVANGISGSGPASPPSGPTGQAAALSALLNSATTSSPSDAASAAGQPAAYLNRCRDRAQALWRDGHPLAATAVRLRCRRLLRRFLVLGGLHGQFTFRTKNGIRTLAFERGTVESVASGTMTVRAADGTQWTWHLISNTVVRQDGSRTSRSAVTDGAQVFVGGPVVSGADDARLIIILPGPRPPASS